MASDFRDHYPSLEPFPLFIDSAPPNSENYFSSPMAMAAIQLLASSSSPHRGKPRVSMPAKVSNYLRLRYYQYEVTFGVYVMTPTEKYVFNLIVLSAFTALLYALFFGFQPFVINTLCRAGRASDDSGTTMPLPLLADSACVTDDDKKQRVRYPQGKPISWRGPSRRIKQLAGRVNTTFALTILEQ